MCVIALSNVEKLQKKGSPELANVTAALRNNVQLKSLFLQNLAPNCIRKILYILQHLSLSQ